MAGRTKVWPVIIAFIAAIALEVVPLPGALQAFRPPFAAMVLIYWAMMWPQRFGLGTAFIIGICLDILHGQLLGQNALSLSIIAYLTVRFHLQIRIFPLWQLTMTVFALLSIEALLQYLVEGVAGLEIGSMARMTRVLSGTLIWPLLLGIMDRVRMQAENRDPSFN
jgi:rod shape-determining protein MreD